MFKSFLRNHALANLAFLLVLAGGIIAYGQLSREQDPNVNFNWVDVITILPGASASDVEKRITDPLERAVRRIRGIKFVSSHSRESISSLVIRFEDVDQQTYDKRVSDLRREIRNVQDEFPEGTADPRIVEINSANAYPTATAVLSSPAYDENMRSEAQRVLKDLERIDGVDRVVSIGLLEPELQILFLPERLQGLGLAPTDIADTVFGFFRDSAAGSVRVHDQSWLVRLVGTDREPGYLSSLPVITEQGEIPLHSVADVVRGTEIPLSAVEFAGQPGVTFAIMKEANANTLDLLDEIKAYFAERNRFWSATGVRLALIDDQSNATRVAIGIMENNAALGLVFVLAVSWLFLGGRIALFTSAGIPFVLAGVFWSLLVLGSTLNVIVLLGIVISLGMLVDDAVVVVEATYYRLQRGAEAITATMDALREVGAPVVTAVFTTIAAFLPLMFMPGVLGDYMKVVPLVVILALVFSLVEAFWMLPAHIIAADVSFSRRSRLQRIRSRSMRLLRRVYTRALIFALRHSRLLVGLVVMVFLVAVGGLASGWIKFDPFASDPKRMFYLNVEMPPSTPLEKTLEKTMEIERILSRKLSRGEARAVVSYAGIKFTETAPLQGDYHGQILFGLQPRGVGARTVEEIIDSMRPDIDRIPGPVSISFLRMASGPPTFKPISIKVRGKDFAEIKRAAAALKEILKEIPGIIDIGDDAHRGRMEIVLKLNLDAVRRSGLDPVKVARAIRLMVDGELVANMQDRGEKVEVRVRAFPRDYQDIDALLRFGIPLASGGQIPLRELVHRETMLGSGNIRHYNFRRAITVEADLNKAEIDTITANRILLGKWEKLAGRYPNIALDLTGELDDIKESLDSLAVLLLLSIGLIYLILGTQFRSYWQPFMVLATVPLAFVGVVLGLIVTRNPLSLYTLYGVIALAGITVNAAIVLISAANERRRRGMGVMHATVYAARRRVVPVIVTSLTTIAGLFSLSAGLGGESLIWGAVATAIVWGLTFSTLLTLFVVPMLYSGFMKEIVSTPFDLPLPAPLTLGRQTLGQRAKSFFGIEGAQREHRKALVELSNNERAAGYYNRGAEALHNGETEIAIKQFANAAKDAPENEVCNAYAAQALLIYMQKIGADRGYLDRARGYLNTLQRLARDSDHLANLERLYALLAAEVENADPQSMSLIE